MGIESRERDIQNREYAEVRGNARGNKTDAALGLARL